MGKEISVEERAGALRRMAVETGFLICLDMLESRPTVDAVEVVRCKDCKYWKDNNDGYPHEECRWGHGETPYANDFCSYGERKEGDR